MASLYLHAVEAEILGALTRVEAQYAIVGGHAIQFHGYLRPAKDLDICVMPNIENAGRVATAFASVSTPVHLNEGQIARLASPSLQMHINGIYHMEVLTSLTGVNIEDVIASGITTIEHGHRVVVANRDHMIQIKLALGRPEDLADVEQLRRTQKGV